MFKLRDHWRAILILLIFFAGIAVFLAFLRTWIVQNPGIVFAARHFAEVQGLPASFLISFVGSLWFIPFPYEIIVVPVVKLHSSPFFALLVISLGATLSDIVNFYTGKYLGQRYILKRIPKPAVSKIQNFLTKYGVATLLIFSFITPVTSYDIVAFVFGGFSKMDIKTFIPATFACRMVHFTFVLLLADVFLKAAGVVI